MAASGSHAPHQLTTIITVSSPLNKNRGKSIYAHYSSLEEGSHKL